VQTQTSESISFYVKKVIINGDTADRESCLALLETYYKSSNYKERLLFIGMTHSLIKNETKIFQKYFSEMYVSLSQDKVKNVKIFLAKTLQKYPDSIPLIPELEDVEANLQDSGIKEIEIIYNSQAKDEYCNILINYEIYYLNFIDMPDPALAAYNTQIMNPENPDLLMDKSEDAYLEKKKDENIPSENPLPAPVSKKAAAIKDEFQEFDDFLAQIDG